MVFGWCVGGVKTVSGGIWVAVRWCLDGMWVVFRCVGGVKMVPGWYVGGVWVVLRLFLGGM